MAARGLYKATDGSWRQADASHGAGAHESGIQPNAMPPDIRAIPWLITAPVSARAITPALGLRRLCRIGPQEQHRAYCRANHYFHRDPPVRQNDGGLSRHSFANPPSLPLVPMLASWWIDKGRGWRVLSWHW